MLKFSYEKNLNKRIIVFGNLPYNISTQILTKWIKIKKLENFYKKFILMFQKEVADRIIEKDNSKTDVSNIFKDSFKRWPPLICEAKLNAPNKIIFSFLSIPRSFLASLFE